MTLAVISCFGVILTAGYMLWTDPARLLRPGEARVQGLPRSRLPREITVLTPLTIMAILLGVLPTLMFFVFTDQTVTALFELFP